MHHDRRGDAEREQTRGSQRPTGESDGAARCDLAVFALVNNARDGLRLLEGEVN